MKLGILLRISYIEKQKMVFISKLLKNLRQKKI